MSQKLSVGRILRFHRRVSTVEEHELPAIVVRPFAGMANVTVFLDGANCRHAFTPDECTAGVAQRYSVPVVEEGGTPPETGDYLTWPARD